VKRLLGKADVEEALSRLDMLTKEECLMVVARNLEVAHHVDANVTTTRELTQGIDNSVKVITWVARGMDNNVRAAKDGAPQCSLTCSMHVPMVFPVVCKISNG
jgi:hypothetical protein